MAMPILRTKLYAPDAGRGIIRRDRLLERLDEGLAGRLTLVSAPAGFGKTTLVARWLADRSYPASWLSVEPADAEPVRFWRYVVAAFQSTLGDAVAESAAILEANDPDIDAVVTSLLNDIDGADLEGRTVLVLDDLHAIDGSDVLGSLGRFIERMPAGLKLVATTRADPDLPIPRLRAAGDLTEVRQGDLRFSREEVKAYFQEALRVEISDPTAASLEERTEGWVASLQLAALSMERLDAADHDDFVRAFAGNDRYVMDYLVDEVLAGQEARVQRFLLATALLDRLSEPVARTLFGLVSPDDDAPDLHEIERRGLFLIPLDRRREWYRYHHLFADLLRMRARAELDVPGILVAASRWYEEEGLIEEAIEYAFRADDPDRAAEILEARFPAMIGRGQFRTIRDTVERLPTERARRSTGICMAMAYVEYLSTRLDAAERWIERGEVRLAETNPDEARLAQQRAHLCLLRAFRTEAQQDVDGSLAGYEAARMGFAERGNTYLECVAEQGLCGVFLAQERLDACDEMGRSAWRKGMETGNYLVSSTAINRMTMGRIAQGRLQEAEEGCRRHLEAIRSEAGGGRLLVVGYARVGLADVLIRRNRLGEADAELAEVEDRARQANSHTLAGRVLLERMRLSLARDDLQRARQASDELAALFADDKILILIRRLYEALRVRVDIAEGRVTAATEWMAQADADASFPTPTALARGDVLRAQGDLRGAAAVFEGAEESARANEAHGWALEAAVRRAAALHALRDGAAVEVVATALAVAQSTDHVRPFLDEGEPMADLISVALAKGALAGLDEGFVPRLLGSFGQDDGEESLLSDRELEVLRLLDAGLSNRDVGERLFVSVGTVKRHTHNIYQKLGAARRTEALLKAREAGIL